jgi:hypothetical protein
MKNTKLLSGVVLLAGMVLSGTAMADRGHGYGGHNRGHASIGFYIGAPYMHPYYPAYPYAYAPPYPYGYYPPVIINQAPVEPPIYIEQQAPVQVPPAASQQASPESYYWYHCASPDGYYPYIKECPAGWQKVSPTPPPQP